MCLGNSPLLHLTIMAGFFDGVYVIVNEFRMGVNEPDRHFQLSPLHVAVWEGRLEIVQFLLHRGADPHLRDQMGRTPLHYAAIRGLRDVFLLVQQHLGHGQRRYELCALMEVRDKYNQTALDIALRPPVSSLVNQTAHSIMSSACSHMYDRWAQAQQAAAARTVVRPLTMPMPMSLGWAQAATAVEVERERERESHPGARHRSVDRVDGVSLNASALYRRYIVNQRPVIITNGELLTASSRVWAFLDRDSFVQRYGDYLLSRGGSKYFDFYPSLNSSHFSVTARAQHAEVEMSIGEWVQRMGVEGGGEEAAPIPGSAAAGPSARWGSEFMAHSVHPASRQALAARRQRAEEEAELRDQIHRMNSMRSTGDPEVFRSIVRAGDNGTLSDRWWDDFPPIPLWSQLCTTSSPSLVGKKSQASSHSAEDPGMDGPEDQEPYQVYLGPAHTSMPIHSHNSSWNILLTGLKRWYVMPPGHGVYAFTRLPDSEEDRANVTLLSQLSREAVQEVWSIPEWLERYGNRLIAQGLVYEFTQHPGEMVYLPHNWVHGTLNLADSVSISQEVCTMQHTDQRYYPVGLGLYGGRDRFRRYKHPLQGMSGKMLNMINKPQDSYDGRFPVFM